MKKILTLMMITLLVALSVVPAFADPTNPPEPGTDSAYEPVDGDPDKLDFDKYFVTNEGQVVPQVEFKYTIEPGEAVPAGNATPEKWTSDFENDGTTEEYETEQAARDAVDQWNTDNPTDPKTFDNDVTNVPAVEANFEIKAGIFNTTAGSEGPTITSAKFGEVNADEHHEKYSTVQTGDTVFSDLANTGTNTSKLSEGDTMPAGKVYSKDTVEVDFSNVQFTEPGIYRYIITEQPVNLAGVLYDTEANSSMKRVVDVYVVDVTDPADTTTPKLEIAGYILHKTESVIKTTDENGSKDENVVASKWAISDEYEKDPATAIKFDSEEAALAEIARRRSMPTDDPNYDEDILDKQEEINDKKEELGAPTDAANSDPTASAYARYNAADKALNPPLGQEDGSTDPSLYKDLRDAEDDLDKLLNGDTPTGDINDIIAGLTDSTDTTGDDNLKKFGRNALMTALNTSTDPKEITVLRRVIEELDAEITIAETAVTDAQDAVDAAKNTLQTIQDEIDALIAEITALEAELAALQAAHNNAEPVEIEWRLSDKSDHYTNELSTYNIEFNKEVEGNQGSKDKYFEFTLKLSGLVAESWQFGGDDYTSIDAAKTAANSAVVPGTGDNAGKYMYNDVPYDTEAKAKAAAAADIVHVEPTVVTVHTDSKFTKAPSKTAATVYEAEAMAKANGRDDDNDLTYSDANEEQKKKYVWTVGGNTYYWNGEAMVNSANGNSVGGLDDFNAAATYTGMAGQQLVADENGKIEWTVYLKDGECIVLKDLPAGITYEVTEKEEDYKKTTGTKTVAHANPAPAGKLHDDPTKGTLNNNVYTGYTNTKNGIIPTGVIMSITGGAILIVIAIAAIVMLNRRRAEDEE